MTDLKLFLDTLPAPALAALGLLLVLQLTLQIIALVDLARRPTAPGGRWIWLGVVLFGQLLGAAIYLVLRRNWSGSAPEAPDGLGGTRRDEALDLLFPEDR